MSTDESLLCLDVGTVRIGVARANTIARIAEPLKTIPNDDLVVATIEHLVAEHHANTVVVGLPQNQHNEDTEQTRVVRDFVAKLEQTISVPFVFQDEADSSKRAEALLKGRGKQYEKAAIDAEAAALILQDYIEEQL